MEWQSPEVATMVEVEAQGRPDWQREDHEVGLTLARDLISRSKRANPGQPSAGALNRGALDAILQQAGCEGMRIYFGEKPDGTRTLVIVGMDEFGNDLDEGLILDHTILCPPLCPLNSALDS